MSQPNGEQSLMHLVQAFLVETVRQVQAGLPDDVVLTTSGRTILRGERGGRPFGVRVRMVQDEDDMWPAVQAIVELDGESSTHEIHPDTTPSGHADVIRAKLEPVLGAA